MRQSVGRLPCPDPGSCCGCWSHYVGNCVDFSYICSQFILYLCRLNIPDTTGWNTPWEFGELIATLRRRLGARLEDIIFSTHCQNDLGLASANS